MSGQITIRIPDELIKALDIRAKRMRRKRAQLVRMAIERFVEESDERRMKTSYERAVELGLVGPVEMGPYDLAERHREYLEENGFGGENTRK